MNLRFLAHLLLLGTVLLSPAAFGQSTPIQLLPANPHYFEYKGKPLVLITSAEHYGAVLNLDFDYRRYLKTLAKEGMNYTRIFTGSYFEIPATSFGIANNTLAPAPGKTITPWTTSLENGKINYRMDSFNPAFFERIKDFMRVADSLDIIVEATLFSSIYTDPHWDINPQNPQNQLGESGQLDRKLAHTLENGKLTTFQKMYVRKLVQELNEFDNLFYEIQNEPWADRGRSVINLANKYDVSGEDWMEKIDLADQASLAWQEEIANTIATEEQKLPKKHLIAQNYSNFYAPLSEVSPAVSILNFHYNWPEAAEMNYHWNKVVGFDESGFAGSSDMVYRRQAWAFIFSGGGLFNNLDYSFFTGNEDGSLKNEAPGGGSAELRAQLSVLSKVIHSMDLAKTKPDKQVVLGSPGLLTFALANGTKGYEIYAVEAGSTSSFLRLNLPTGSYEFAQIDPLTGKASSLDQIEAKGDRIDFEVNLPAGEMLYRLIKK